MRISGDMKFEPEEMDDGVFRAGTVTFSEDSRADMRVMIALVEREGNIDVHMVAGPSRSAGMDQQNSLVFRGGAGTAFLRLAARAYRALQEAKEAKDRE